GLIVGCAALGALVLVLVSGMALADRTGGGTPWRAVGGTLALAVGFLGVGLTPGRVAEFRDGPGRRLARQWIEAPAPAPARPAAAAEGAQPAAAMPDAGRLRALHEAVSLGHVRGVLRLLDLLDAERPDCRDFSDRLRTLARQFQLDAMSGLLRQALDVSTHAASGANPDEPPA
uniref:hypothetical protein n=1 Tax=Sphaerotilus montanus TaxID=522889 RepID=UPI003FA1E5A3